VIFFFFSQKKSAKTDIYCFDLGGSWYVRTDKGEGGSIFRDFVRTTIMDTY